MNLNPIFPEETEENQNPLLELKGLLESNVQYGGTSRNPSLEGKVYRRSRRNQIKGSSSGFTYVFNSVEIVKSARKLYNDLYNFSKLNQGDILFFNSKVNCEDLVKTAADLCSSPYTNKWVGGYLTNFRTIRRSIVNFVKRKEELSLISQGQSQSNLTDREISIINRWISKRSHYNGLVDLKKLPIAVFILAKDAKTRKLVINEANAANIPCISISNTSHNPNSIEFPILGNDSSLKSVEMLLKIISEAITKGKEGNVMEKKEVDLANDEQLEEEKKGKDNNE